MRTVNCVGMYGVACKRFWGAGEDRYVSFAYSLEDAYGIMGCVYQGRIPMDSADSQEFNMWRVCC
jgi:hypothetical protein